MNKSTKKTINYLSQWIGHEIIRTKPTCFDNDWTFTTDPILLLGFTTNGCIRFHYTGELKEKLGIVEIVLPFHFTDRNWITVKKALKAKNNRLNQWRGKRIKRIRPTRQSDHPYMSPKFPTLISASKHHLVIMLNDVEFEGRKRILNSNYVNAEDWSLAE